MKKANEVDYAALDQPELLQALFHPRPGWGTVRTGEPAPSLWIPVADDIGIGARFHMAESDAPNILFFHGNGEIVSDYDSLGSLYNQHRINFLAADYRGYGASNGVPSVSTMMRDCHVIFDYTRNWLVHNGFTGPLLVMGRSLGSASALELAAARPLDIAGLIIESGFSDAAPLLSLLGAPRHIAREAEDTGFRHREKIRAFTGPTLIIHAEHDRLIPFSNGQALFEASGAKDKWLLKISGANHNDIFAKALEDYLSAVADIAHRGYVCGPRPSADTLAGDQTDLSPGCPPFDHRSMGPQEHPPSP
jgi:hypothetical protein